MPGIEPGPEAPQASTLPLRYIHHCNLKNESKVI